MFGDSEVRLLLCPTNSPYTQNRELSWLRFNDRVLEEAMDATVPLLERLKFVAIFTSNLDEFFMIRVGSLYDLSLLNPQSIDKKSGMTPQEQLHAIYRAVRPLYAKRERCFYDIMSQLQVHGIHFLRFKDLRPDEAKYVKQYFKQSIAPILSPQIVDAHHPFPHLQNKVTHVVARLNTRATRPLAACPSLQHCPASSTSPAPACAFDRGGNCGGIPGGISSRATTALSGRGCASRAMPTSRPRRSGRTLTAISARRCRRYWASAAAWLRCGWS